MNPLKPDQAFLMPVSTLAALPSEALFHLKNDATDLLSIAKATAEHIDRAIELKFAERAQAQRFAAGKDTGIVHFDDGQVRITADLPKKIDWDQQKLTDLVKRIADAGDDPREYVEISYRVSETKYNAWPEALRSQFTAARTLKTGRPGFRLALIANGNEGGAQ